MTDKQPEALESLASSIGAAPYSIDADPQGQEGERDYPFLPTSVGDVEDWGDGKARNVTWSNAPPSGGTSLYTADQMRAYVDADRAIRASHGQAPAPAAVAGPVVNRATVIEWLDANDIEVTDRQMDGLFHSAAPASQGDALDAMRYRWLRENWSTMGSTYHDDKMQLYVGRPKYTNITPVDIDVAIDAARAAQEGK